jgi:16S rRNA (cytidine1402-2'-O)-methyltransferase
LARTASSRGTLHVVATPIGNLNDISLRSLTVLSEARLIACEDTRVTRALLSRHRLRGRVVSCHRHNERKRTEEILEVLRRGEDAAYVTDGGTPGVSDPGAYLVRRAREDGHSVVPIPGASALTSLLSVSGWPASSFTFLGFLPHRRGERRRVLREIRSEPRPLLFFESPHRLREALNDALEVLGNRQAFVGREMTKIHEEYLSGTLESILKAFTGRAVRGEVTLLVDGAGAQDTPVIEQPIEPVAVAVLRLIEEGWDRREAMRRVARERGLSRRVVYRELTRLKKGEGG